LLNKNFLLSKETVKLPIKERFEFPKDMRSDNYVLGRRTISSSF